MPLMLGRKPRTYKPMLHWSSLRHLSTSLPHIPKQHNWLNGMPSDYGMFLNDTLGCCVPAAAYHARQVWTFNANPPESTEPDRTVEAAYEKYCGYNPRNPSSDQGCYEQTVLNAWYSTGMPLVGGAVDKLLIPPIELDVRNPPDICEAIFECGLVFIGFNVPAYIMSSVPPPVWMLDQTADQAIVGGHAVVLCGYHKVNRTFDFLSWGAAYRMKWGFFQNFSDEAYALCDPTWVEQTGKTPLGLTAAQLEALAPTL